MKYIAIFIACLLASCTNTNTTFLEGHWRSNKELTLKNIKDNDKLSNHQREYLHQELRKLTLVFKDKKNAIYFSDDHNESDEIEWGEFSIISSNKQGFSISITNSVVKNKIFTYVWSGNCFYLDVIEWGYREYFCKIPSP